MVPSNGMEKQIGPEVSSIIFRARRQRQRLVFHATNVSEGKRKEAANVVRMLPILHKDRPVGDKTRVPYHPLYSVFEYPMMTNTIPTMNMPMIIISEMLRNRAPGSSESENRGADEPVPCVFRAATGSPDLLIFRPHFNSCPQCGHW